LEPDEFQSGVHLFNELKGMDTRHVSDVPVELSLCGYAKEFVEVVEKLIKEDSLGSIPLLHIECHGIKEKGLEFSNGSELPWADVAELLTRLNRACNFNLFALFSACFGAYFLGEMHATRVMPCYAIVAPTEEADPSELLRGFRKFYSVLLSELDAGKATSAIERENLQNGRWFGQTAELWFERVLLGYVETHCTCREMKRRPMEMYHLSKDNGYGKTVGQIRRQLTSYNKDNLLRIYFEKHFDTIKFPKNINRFSAARDRLDVALQELWAKPEYRY
jgi:hypothetical protein